MSAEEETLRLSDRYADVVFRISIVLLKNRADACDAVQEIFMRLMQDDTVFSSDEHAKAWLITVARNYCRDQLRQFWKARRTDEDVYQYMDQGENIVWQNESEETAALREALFTLPEKYREILYLHYYEGYRLEEIAAMTGKNASTLRSRLSRARQMLKKCVTEEGEMGYE